MTLEIGLFAQSLTDMMEAVHERLEAATSKADVEAVRIEYVGGKRGKIKAMQDALRKLPDDEKPRGGRYFNEAKREIEDEIRKAASRNFPPPPAPIPTTTEIALTQDSAGARAALYKLEESRPTDSHPFDHAGRLDELTRDLKKDAKAKYKAGEYTESYRLSSRAEACEYAAAKLRRQ